MSIKNCELLFNMSKINDTYFEFVLRSLYNVKKLAVGFELLLKLFVLRKCFVIEFSSLTLFEIEFEKTLFLEFNCDEHSSLEPEQRCFESEGVVLSFPNWK